jgi:hypothetical protein
MFKLYVQTPKCGDIMFKYKSLSQNTLISIFRVIMIIHKNCKYQNKTITWKYKYYNDSCLSTEI